MTAAQAVWLGVVLRLKTAGVKVPTAARIAACAEGVRGPGRGEQVSPFEGAFRTGRRWYLDVGDTRFIRLVTEARSLGQGIRETPWVDMHSRRPIEGASPVVYIRVDVSALARLLQDSVKE
jgi:hypothetical protein